MDLPPQFEEVVDIVVSESRAKANENILKEERKSELQMMSQQSDSQGREPTEQLPPQASYADTLEKMGLEEKEDKPFWAKFLRSDYMIKDDGPILSKVMQVLDGEKAVDEIIMDEQNS